MSNLHQYYPSIQIAISNDIDFIHMKTLLTDIGIIQFPPLNADYTFISHIGKGSQASVDLYKYNSSSIMLSMH